MPLDKSLKPLVSSKSSSGLMRQSNPLFDQLKGMMTQAGGDSYLESFTIVVIISRTWSSAGSWATVRCRISSLRSSNVSAEFKFQNFNFKYFKFQMVNLTDRSLKLQSNFLEVSSAQHSSIIASISSRSVHIYVCIKDCSKCCVFPKGQCVCNKQAQETILFIACSQV